MEKQRKVQQFNPLIACETRKSIQNSVINGMFGNSTLYRSYLNVIEVYFVNTWIFE